MKNFIILLFVSLIVLSSCSMRKDNVDTPHPGNENSLLTKHTWNGVNVVQYVNGQLSGKRFIKNLNYNFEKNNHFFVKENGQITNEGTWHLLNIFDQPVLRLSYNKDKIIKDYEINHLTEEVLQLSTYATDDHNNSTQKEYSFSK